MPRIGIERVYEAAGTKPRRRKARILVDRVWPRGVRRDSLALDAWCKDAAPSTDLRRWFGHDPERWDEFRRRYRRELERAPGTWSSLLERAREGDLLLLYGARDSDRNNAVVLRELLIERLREEKTRSPRSVERRRRARPAK